MKLKALGPHALSHGHTDDQSVGFLDSLHDPSAYVAPHDISDAAVPVNEHSLPPPILSESRM